MGTKEYETYELESDPLPERDPEKLAREIAQRNGLLVADLKGPSRFRHIQVARTELYLALRAKPYQWSYPAIGRFVNRDHTTVLHAVQKAGGS
jgi:chromosomal replication initiation ATPase DnaA